MKANKLLLAAALFTGLATLGLAGPGPEYWARMNAAAKKSSYPSIWQTKPAADTNAQAKPVAKPAAKPAGEVAATCATCACCAKKV